MFGLGPMELIIVGVIAVLLFGNRLPSVMRSMGQGMVEFKRGMRDIQSQMDQAVHTDSAPQPTHRNAIDDYDEPTAPKFEPPAREPQTATAAAADVRPADSGAAPSKV